MVSGLTKLEEEAFGRFSSHDGQTADDSIQAFRPMARP
jgi:hypothetical protein